MLTLLRYSYTENRVLGLLFKDQDYFCDTLERPWNDNKPNISCIPEGVYTIRHRQSEAFHIHDCYEVENVPNRSAILIHAANSVNELQGCIAVGVKALSLLYNSRDTLFKLITLVGETDTLVVERPVAKVNE